MLRLGIDVGDSKTVCVVMDEHSALIGMRTQASTPDILAGIDSVLEQILKLTRIDPLEIGAVMIGTSHCYNALVKGENLAKVAVIRLGQIQSVIPPLFDAPETFRRAVGLHFLQTKGGHELDGSSSVQKLYRHEIEAFLQRDENREIEALVITGTFSPMNDSHEKKVAEWIRDQLGPEFPITVSHELGSVGFIERENAAILNAALSKVMTHSLHGLGALLKGWKIDSPIYFTQNDGTLMSYEHALRYPIRTLRSEITNGFRGASFLTGIEDGVVVDVHRDTTYIGTLEGGFPKEGHRGEHIAGIRVNVDMPKIVRLPFGACTPFEISHLDEIFQAVQRFQPRYEPLPILFVGEGGAAFAAHFKYPWSEVLLPRHYPYVNAIGACIAPISGNSDRMYWLDHMSQSEAVERTKQETIKAAILAGAKQDTVVIQSVKTIPFVYLPSKALRIKVKAIGTL